MKYKDLQAKAKSLGFPYVGKSREELEMLIASKVDVSGTTTPIFIDNDPVDPEEKNEPSEEDSKVNGEDSEIYENETIDTDKNIAVVMNGKYEIRRYTFENHGISFENLANQFAKKKGYTVELKKD